MYDYKPWIYFKNLVQNFLERKYKVKINLEYNTFLQFKPRYIRDPHTGKLERCIKISDVAKYLSELAKED